ncbi:hypothetical protein CDL12_22700 [Handroanthus impetiginosus]|uniref:Uncharacterized protein n=1 Tax=Handroanthus impetiginosus TaxID=429701 RepID=A0A2G9GHU3_9LAMI|nr:hypothetical protein CDL12_22700 [Handroanthus impetiginosus]
MEEKTIIPAEISSVAYLNKKRKFQAELLEMPCPKHVCFGQRLEYDASSDSSTAPKKARSAMYARGCESNPESPKDSCSFHSDPDSVLSLHEDATTYHYFPETHTSVEPSASSAGFGGTSSEIGLHSLESRSITKSSSSKSGPFEELDCLRQDYGLYTSDKYEELLEFDGIEHCTQEDLDNLLYANGVVPNNYILSSGRWSVNQDTQQGTEKLTIDKEFEQYFSMLML